MPLSIAMASEPSSFVARPFAEARVLAVWLSTMGARAALLLVADRGGVCLTVDQGEGRFGQATLRPCAPAQPVETTTKALPTTNRHPRQAEIISIPHRLENHEQA